MKTATFVLVLVKQLFVIADKIFDLPATIEVSKKRTSQK